MFGDRGFRIGEFGLKKFFGIREIRGGLRMFVFVRLLCEVFLFLGFGV